RSSEWIVQSRRGDVVDEADGDVCRNLRGFAIVADDRKPLRIDCANDCHLVASGQPGRHSKGVAGGGAPTTHGHADEVEVQQLTKLAAELEPGLVEAMVGTGLAIDGGKPFVASDDLVDRRRNMMLPDAGAKEA